MEKTSKLKKYEEDEIIVKEGQLTNEMYKIISGKVAAYINYGEENECLLGVFNEQRTFGESGMLCGRPCMYTIVALEEVLLMKITIEEFDDFINNNNQNARNIIKNLAREVAVMRCNLDLLIEDMGHAEKSEVMNVRALKEKMQQSMVKDWNNHRILDQWI